MSCQTPFLIVPCRSHAVCRLTPLDIAFAVRGGTARSLQDLRAHRLLPLPRPLSCRPSAARSRQPRHRRVQPHVRQRKCWRVGGRKKKTQHRGFYCQHERSWELAMLQQQGLERGFGCVIRLRRAQLASRQIPLARPAGRGDSDPRQVTTQSLQKSHWAGALQDKSISTSMDWSPCMSTEFASRRRK